MDGAGTTAAVRAPKPLTLWAVALAGLATAVVSAVLGMSSDHVSEPGLRVALLNWIMLPYVVSGLVAWWHRPMSRFGPLMIAAGFGMFLSSLSWANAAVPFTIGQAFDLLPVVLFLHVFLAYPTGWLGGRLERGIIGTGYVAAVGGQLAVMLLGGFGPDNVLAVVEQPAAADLVHLVLLLMLGGLALAGVTVLAARRRRAGPSLRLPVDLLVDSFALALVMIAALLVMGAFGAPGFTTVQRLTFAVIGLAPVAFLVGLLNARLARGAVGDLVLELRGEPVELHAALARALHDQSLRLVYWLPQFASWADQEGRQVELPERDDTRAVTMIERAGEPVAALEHDPSLNDEPQLLDAVCAAAGMALENGRLRAELRANLDEVRGSRLRVIEAGQRERQRLERDLHDGAQQRLIALSLNLGLLERRLNGDAQAGALLTEARHEIAVSLEELRAVARGLHPAVLSGHGLEVALESIAAKASVPVRLTVRCNGRLAEQVEVAAYYVVCESIANIDKHAAATSATVQVARTAGQLVVEVLDDGIGGADTERGTGLRGLADRVEALGGRLRVWTRAGGGTRVRAELPCG
jgi:signal transduction histidine kinase